MSSPMDDPEIAAAINGGSAAPAAAPVSDDPEIRAAVEADRALNPPQKARVPLPYGEDTWANAARGVGDAALTMGSTALRGVNSAINDLLPGEQGRAEEAKRIAADPVLNYQPHTAGGQIIVDAAGNVLKPIGAATSWVHSQIANATSPRTADVVGDLASLAPFKGTRELPGAAASAGRNVPGLRVLMPAAASEAIEEGHALTAIAKAEQAKLDAREQAATSAGVATREVTPANRYFNNLANKNLQTPGNSPVTHGMIDAAEAAHSAPAYQVVYKTPAYKLGSNYQAVTKDPRIAGAISEAEAAIKEENPDWKPLDGKTMDGSQANQLSKQLRDVARGQFSDAENPNLTYAQQLAAKKSAQANYKAAKAVEDGYREGTGNDTAADNWANARRFHAQAEAWRGTIDNSGNVNPTKIKRVLSDESSPEMEEAATNADRLQKSASTQPPGRVKTFIRDVAAPATGALVGGATGLPGGSEGGAALASGMAHKLVK